MATRYIVQVLNNDKENYAQYRIASMEQPQKRISINDAQQLIDYFAEVDATAPVSSVLEIHWQGNTLLQNNVRIADTPGLNVNNKDEVLVEKFISAADAIILVIDGHRVITDREMMFLKQRQEKNITSLVFVVINKWDKIEKEGMVVAERQKQQLLHDLQTHNINTNRVFILSAKAAFAFRVQENPSEHKSAVHRRWHEQFEAFEYSLLSNVAQSNLTTKFQDPLDKLQNWLTFAVDETTDLLVALQQDIAQLDSDIERLRLEIQKVDAALPDIAARLPAFEKFVDQQADVAIQAAIKEFVQLVPSRVMDFSRSFDATDPSDFQAHLANIVMKNLAVHIGGKLQAVQLERERFLNSIAQAGGMTAPVVATKPTSDLALSAVESHSNSLSVSFIELPREFVNKIRDIQVPELRVEFGLIDTVLGTVAGASGTIGVTFASAMTYGSKIASKAVNWNPVIVGAGVAGGAIALGSVWAYKTFTYDPEFDFKTKWIALALDIFKQHKSQIRTAVAATYISEARQYVNHFNQHVKHEKSAVATTLDTARETKQHKVEFLHSIEAVKTNITQLQTQLETLKTKFSLLLAQQSDENVGLVSSKL